jgi:hypothetical protein
MLDKRYAQQAVAGIIIVAGCAFLIFLGWLTSEQRHGLDGIILWCFFYGLPVAVLIRWFQPYVKTIAARLPGRERRRQLAALAAIVRQRVETRRLTG